jgi:2-polyprenyl-3-methyl-5-hydroxy-6-metoxy-1,4-benzoquinol methylase
MTYERDELGIHRPVIPVTHRDDEYQESGFAMLHAMQAQHFWYVGRHRFLMKCLNRHLAASHKHAIDLGGGVGGWVKYLAEHSSHAFSSLALGDSSEVALLGAQGVLPASVELYQVDLMAAQWHERWDVIFLLDVIEHCPDDAAVMQQAYEALTPGGVLIVSTPALMRFWSYNDEYARHLRRYNIADYQRLAQLTGFELVDARYFMFLLSPLYWLSRKTKPRDMTNDEIERAVESEHAVPSPLINAPLTWIFSAESVLGTRMKFPWGTSVLGVFVK